MTHLNLPWDIPAPFSQRVTVGPQHQDQFGHTNNVMYLQWCEQVAWAHSLSLNLSFADYQRLGVGCVVRKHELEYLAATFAEDELALATWIHECDGKFTMWRRYQIIRLGDQKTVLRGATQFVCIDLKTGRPKRMPPEFVAAYRPVSQSSSGA